MESRISTPITVEGRRLAGEVTSYLKKRGKFPEEKLCKQCKKTRAIGKPRSRSGLCKYCISENQERRAREWEEFLKNQKAKRVRGSRKLIDQDPGIFSLPALD